jgi:hypothetical protein
MRYIEFIGADLNGKRIRVPTPLKERLAIISDALSTRTIIYRLEPGTTVPPVYVFDCEADFLFKPPHLGYSFLSRG